MENYKKTAKPYYEGEQYDSMDEIHYLMHLQKLKASGEILNYERGEKCILIPKFVDNSGKTILPITYTPDFLIYHLDGSLEYIEIKGYMMEDAALKVKLFKYSLLGTGIRFTILTRNLKHGDESGFIEYDKLKKIRSANRRAKDGRL